MKESTYLRIFHNWKRGEDTVLNKYKYSILYAPLMFTWYFIRADKNDENWDWYEPCPDYILDLVDQVNRKYRISHEIKKRRRNNDKRKCV